MLAKGWPTTATGAEAAPLDEPSSRGRLGSVTSELVADWLRQLILNGDLPPGARLRQELIASKAGSSRLPVREALRILEGEGLVVLEANKGGRVASLDLRELDLLYSTRAALEPIVIADSLENISEDAIARCAAILDEIDAGSSTVEFLLLDREFHLLTYSGCSSQHLLSVVERLWNATQSYRRAFLASRDEEWDEVIALDHRLIMNAVARRNGELAATLVTAHITRTQVALRAGLGEAASTREHPDVVDLPPLHV